MKLDSWVRAIPESQSHGSGTLQKRLWKLVSDYVRIRDWNKYGGACVATGRYIERWQDGDAGHFKSYSKCNGLFKFDERNIFLQSKSSNGFGDFDDWLSYEKEMQARTGLTKEKIDLLNRDFPLKFTTEQTLDKMRDILGKMKDLPEKPVYYERVMELLQDYGTL